MGVLKDRMKMDMELKNFSIRTIKSYLSWVKDFTTHYGVSPEKLGDDDIRNYLYHLLKEKRASQSSMNQAYSALRFFYEKTLGRTWNEDRIPRSNVPKRLPVVLSKEEVQGVFSNTRNLKHRAALMTIYSGGLRLNEVTHLKPNDIDSKRMTIKVRGKGDKDRYTLLGEKALDMLRTYWKIYHPSEWLFPSRIPSQPISGSTVQKAFKKSLHLAGIKKKASVHTLLLGHTTARTTAIYLHVTRKDLANVKSPIDLLEDADRPIL
jgi:integrase/recombinase XerD